MLIITVWQGISPDVTVEGFKNCCISSAVAGTDYDTLSNDSEEDGNVTSVRNPLGEVILNLDKYIFPWQTFFF
jgi:hypothetical protein